MRKLLATFKDLDINMVENLGWLPVGKYRVPNDTRIAHSEAHRTDLIIRTNQRLQPAAARGGKAGFRKSLARIKTDMLAGNRTRLGIKP